MENPFKPAEKQNPKILFITALFAFIGIAVLAIINQEFDDPYLMASFGSTAVLIYAAPKAPFSRPKNVLFGHLFSAIIAIAVVVVFDAAGILGDYQWVVCGLAVSGSIVIMVLTGTVHPPAGATALNCAIIGMTDWMYLVRPIFIGIVAMMLVAYAANIVKEKIE